MEKRMADAEMDIALLKQRHEDLRENHQFEVRNIKSAIAQVNGEIQQIVTMMRSIKWWLIGGISFLTAQQVGILEMVKMMLSM